MPPTGSTRWCPTPEQLMMLEGLYRRGIRTPTASQIQHIASHLSHYGRIEGKNVFYWFQNHKARDRQNLRRKLLKQQQQQLLQQQHQTHYHLLHQIEISPPPSSTAISPDQAQQSLPQRREWNMIDCWGGWMEVEKANYISDQEWKMMMMMMMNDTSSITPHCNMPAPKTLQLFPVTTKALKDECFTSHQDQYFCCSTSSSSTNC